MNLDLVIKYEALSKKGLRQGYKILAFPTYRPVCFSHASQLAQSGVVIRTSIVEKDYSTGYCDRCIEAFEPFVVSLGDKDSEYEESK